jgi:Na+-driven multidrug efflux pump
MAAIVGQNYGARNYGRIAATFRQAWVISLVFMLFWTMMCQLLPAALIGVFSRDAEVVRFGRIYLTVFSLGNLMVGTIMVAGAAFQGLGKTYPSLAGAVLDNALFAGMVFTLPAYFNWGIASIWWIKVTTAAMEALVVAYWLKSELRRMRARMSNPSILPQAEGTALFKRSAP